MTTMYAAFTTGPVARFMPGSPEMDDHATGFGWGVVFKDWELDGGIENFLSIDAQSTYLWNYHDYDGQSLHNAFGVRLLQRRPGTVNFSTAAHLVLQSGTVRGLELGGDFDLRVHVEEEDTSFIFGTRMICLSDLLEDAVWVGIESYIGALINIL